MRTLDIEVQLKNLTGDAVGFSDGREQQNVHH